METIKQKLNIEKNKIGLVGSLINIKEYDETDNDVSAHINPQNWNIEISIRKGYSPIQDKRQKAYARKNKIENGLETLLSGVCHHEFGHWELPLNSEKGCPYDIYNHDKILEAIRQALPNDKKANESYVANAFEDLIDNARCREYLGNLLGQTLFWDNEGLRCEKQAQKGYTPFYEAFVKLNMHLSGSNFDKSLLKRHYTKNNKVDNAVKKTIQEMNLSENIQDTSSLFYKKNWAKMAGIFARNLAELLDTSPTERLSAFSQQGEGQGQGSQDDEKQSKLQAGNGIEQKMKTGEGKEEVAYGRYASGEKLSSNFTNYEQLDALYRKLARPLAIKVDAMTKSQGLNISPLTFRVFDEEKDDIKKIKLSKFFVTEQGLQFAYQDMPLTITAKSKFQRRSFPDFKMIVLDNSGSMEEAIDSNGVGKTSAIPWGDNSKYHYALLGFYGIENFLQKQGIAQYIQHGLSLFSSSTRYKEAGFSEIDKVRKLALSPEFRGTVIDAKILEKSLLGRESFVLSLSDGEVGNWESEKSKFMQLAKNNYYAHIQIGSGTGFSSDLENAGIPVFYVTSGSDLSKLMVDITKKTYDKFTKPTQGVK